MTGVQAFARGSVLAVALTAGSDMRAEPYVFPDAWIDVPASEVVPGGLLRFPYAEMPRTFNPLVSIEANLVTGLNTNADLGAPVIGWFRPDDRSLEPRAAESWVISDDGRIIDVNLRPELRWSDGTPITALDYLTSYRLQMDPDAGVPAAEAWTVGDETITVEVTGRHSLRFVIPGPDRLALQTVVGLYPLPDHVFGETYRTAGAEAVTALWGVDTPPEELVFGGFMRLTEVRPEERMTFERNPYFGEWNVDAAGRPLPYLDSMVWTFVSSDTALTMFLAGELDGIRPRGLEDLGAVNVAVANHGLDAVVVESAFPIESTYFIAFNWNLASDPFKQALFRDRDFRKAVAHLVDRQAIIDLAHSGAGFALSSGIHPSYADWFHDGLAVPAYDPEAAAALLEGLGFTRRDPAGFFIDAEGRRAGFTLSVTGSTPFNLAVATVVADMVREAGLDVRVQALPLPLMVDLVSSSGDDRGFEAMFVGFVPSDPAWPFHAALYGCDGPVHLFNRSGACLSPTEHLIDQLMRRGRATLDDDEARRIGREIQVLMLDLNAMIYLTVPASHYIGHGRVRGNFAPELWNASNGFGWFFLNSVR